MSLYDIPEKVGSALPLSLTSSNIPTVFRKTGMYPYNRHLFTELDFAPAFIPNTPNTEKTLDTEVVSTLNSNPPEDVTPPLLPSLSTYKPPTGYQ